MTTLSEALEHDPENETPGPSCGMGWWLHGLERKERDAVQAWLSNPGYGSKAIHRRLEPVDGFDVSDFTLNRHRRGGCHCG